MITMDEIAAMDRMRSKARRPLYSERTMIVALASGLLSEGARRTLRAERRDLYARQRMVKACGELASRLASMAPAYVAVCGVAR